MKMAQRRIAVVASVLIIVTAGVVTAAVASSGSNNQAPKVRVVYRQHASSKRLERIFGVLQRNTSQAHSATASTAESLPQGVTNAMENNQEGGLEPLKAVFTGGTYSTWVVPGTKEICLVNAPTRADGVPGGICGTIAAAEHGLAGSSENTAGERIVFGLAPNGNSTVTVTNANGTTESTPVANNVYEITSGDPVTATLKTASGVPETRQLP